MGAPGVKTDHLHHPVFLSACLIHWISNFLTQVFPTLATKCIKFSITNHCPTLLITITANVRVYSTVCQININFQTPKPCIPQFTFTRATFCSTVMGQLGNFLVCRQSPPHKQHTWGRSFLDAFAEYKLMATFSVTCTSTVFSNTTPTLSNKMYPLDKALSNCATYKTTHTLENLRGALILLFVGSITVW
jgi:hypothetical protein